MQFWLRICVLFVLTLVLANARETRSQSAEPTNEPELRRYRRIISGQSAKNSEYPFIVSIQAKLRNGLHNLLFGGLEHFCGGTLIASRWILTAAHCMYAYTEEGELIRLLDVKQWHVRMATEKLRPSIMDRLKGLLHRAYNSIFGYRKPQTFYHIKKIVIHPDYVEGFLENDIALLKLKEPLLVHRMPTLDILPMPNATENYVNWPAVGQNCTALGWGCACATCPPEMYMQVLQIPIIAPQVCRKMYKAPINLTEAKEFCAGFFRANTGICPGDSGGPLVCEHSGQKLLAGIVSATHAKKPESYPAVFTRVSYFVDWVRSVIQKDGD
ncbi:hypothetical protein SprV_0200674100 [Sparganum proliferum]